MMHERLPTIGLSRLYTLELFANRQSLTYISKTNKSQKKNNPSTGNKPTPPAFPIKSRVEKNEGGGDNIKSQLTQHTSMDPIHIVGINGSPRDQGTEAVLEFGLDLAKSYKQVTTNFVFIAILVVNQIISQELANIAFTMTI
jgi:hypothetical protein